ncbi:hypothetical protein EYF80_028243 [Liparis tanakae]|uniref:Uncharacterized protein n=1 Tax=Liparis tanakae TaxID=230148 RepID=A0A4Z2H6H2_9TELE|nr:hypothetical protein EYF80_028243 [Liparis tanakae]
MATGERRLTLFRAQAWRTLSYFWGSSSLPNRMLLRMVPGNTQGCWAAYNHLNPADADQRLRQLLDGQREEQGERELDGPVEGDRDEHASGGDGVAQEDVGGEGHEDDDLAAGKEGGHVEPPEVGALQDLADLFPGERGRQVEEEQGAQSVR